MKSSQIVPRVLFGFPLLAALACAGEIAPVPQGPAVAVAGGPGGGTPADAPTYWRDVAPILRDKCTSCHQAGGIGPFRLTSYDEARRMALPMASATSSGVMPPFLVTHDGTCGDFHDGETLTPAQIAVIKRWAENGQLEGTPTVEAVRTPVAPFAADEQWQTPTIVPIATGGALAENDEYRCFSHPTTIEKDRFIVGSDVVPGNATLVHHVEVFVVHPQQQTPSGKTNAEVMAAMDAADDRPGWECFGDAGEGVAVDGTAVVWAPGQGAVHFPEKMGMPLRKGDQLVVQIHYNLAHPGAKGQSDSSTVRLSYADAVERKLMVIAPDKFLNTAFTAQPDSLPPGDRATPYTWTLDGSDFGGDFPELEILAVMPHMHGRGVRQTMHLRQDGGPNACFVEVKRWDFHWQKFYFFEGQRPRFNLKSQLEVTCEYDTFKDRAPVYPGWGTGNEMCAAILLVALPAGS